MASGGGATELYVMTPEVSVVEQMSRAATGEDGQASVPDHLPPPPQVVFKMIQVVIYQFDLTGQGCIRVNDDSSYYGYILTYEIAA